MYVFNIKKNIFNHFYYYINLNFLIILNKNNK